MRVDGSWALHNPISAIFITVLLLSILCLVQVSYFTTTNAIHFEFEFWFQAIIRMAISIFLLCLVKIWRVTHRILFTDKIYSIIYEMIVYKRGSEGILARLSHVPVSLHYAPFIPFQCRCVALADLPSPSMKTFITQIMESMISVANQDDLKST